MSEQEAFYMAALNSVSDGVYFVDQHRRITFWNKGAERITGFSAEQVLGSSCGDSVLMHVDSSGTLLCHGLCPLAETLTDGKPREAEMYLRHARGHRIPVLVKAVPLRDASGRLAGGVEVFSEHSALVAAMRRGPEQEQRTDLDPLTGAGDRRALERWLRQALAEADASGTGVGLLLADIDRFAAINDRYGHEAGDHVLRMVAETIRHNVRISDRVGRWGDDRFLVILRGVDRTELAAIADKLRALVERSQLTAPPDELRVTVSVGATAAGRSEEPAAVARRVEELLRRAKSAGRNTVALDG